MVLLMLNIYYSLKELSLRSATISLLNSYCANATKWVGMGEREWGRRCERQGNQREREEGGEEGSEEKDIRKAVLGFPGGAVVENLPANAGHTGSSPGLEDPTCRGATRPVSHNYWACASGACAPQQERPRQWEARAPRWRVASTCHN